MRLRRAFFLLFLLAFFALLSGCGEAAAEKDGYTGLTVYYRLRGDGLDSGSAVGKVEYSVPDTVDMLHEALRFLGEQPTGRHDLISAFPPELRISAYSLTDGQIQVVFTQGYSALHPVERTLVRSCLVLTLCGLQEIESVSVYEEDRLLESGLTPEILLLESTEESGYQAEVTLWFPAKEGDSLVSERRQLTIAQYRPLAEYAAEELVNGPQAENAVPALPPGTKLRSVKLNDGLCVVDLSETFITGRPKAAAAERLSVYALVNTMTELSGAEQVLITVEGQRLEAYTHMDLNAPLRRAEEFTAPYRADKGWFSVNLYLGTAGGKLAPVSVGMEEPDLENLVAQSLEMLLALEDTWGYKKLIPPGTEIVELEIRERICYLQLSAPFLQGNREEALLAARAMADTAIDAGNLLGMRIRVGGVQYQNGELFVKDSEWIVD